MGWLTTFTGAAVALIVAWLSIIVAIRLPLSRILPLARLRVVAALTLTVLGLMLLGAPLPTWSPLAVLSGTASVAMVWPRRAEVGVP